MEMHEIADRHYDAIHKRDEAIYKAERDLRDAFISETARIATTANEPTRFTWSGSMASAMFEALDYNGGPQTHELFDILVKVAKGDDQRVEAMDFIIKMANSFAKYNTEIDE